MTQIHLYRFYLLSHAYFLDTVIYIFMHNYRLCIYIWIWCAVRILLQTKNSYSLIATFEALVQQSWFWCSGQVVGNILEHFILGRHKLGLWKKTTLMSRMYFSTSQGSCPIYIYIYVYISFHICIYIYIYERTITYIPGKTS